MEIVENEEEDYEPRFSNGSMSCLFPLTNMDSPRTSISYNKLHQQPLRLGVLKLDGSSFEIEAAKMGTVGELKRAVEAAFSHLPKTGNGRVSWEHVWGQFCLCYEGQKLLTDSDCIGTFGIKDGDQLQFIHHASNNSVSIQPQKEDSDSDDEPHISPSSRDGQKNTEKDDDHQIEISEENHDYHAESDDDVISHCKYRLSHLFRACFPYRRLPSCDSRSEESNSPSRSSKNMQGSFMNGSRLSSDSHESPRETWKRK